jgi:flagellar hook protein FlgE
LDSNGDLITSEGYHIRAFYPTDFTIASGTTPEKLTNTIDNVTIPTQVLNPVKGAGFTFAVTDGTGIKSIKLVNQAATTQPAAALDTTTGVLTITGNFSDSSDLITSEQMQAIINKELASKNISQNVFVGGSADIAAFNEISTDGIIASNIDKNDLVKLTSYGIEKDGSVKAIYGDGTVNICKIALANFQNAAGLNKMGGNTYTESPNSGSAQIASADELGGTVQQGYLEMSKVDLANEFTEMIITSRAFQANSRTITTSDEMLQELLNLKR